MYDENERLQHALLKRSALERELRDAEILVGLVRRHLRAADEYIKQLFDESAPKDRIMKVTPEMEMAVVEQWKAGDRSFIKIGLGAGGLAASTVKKILTDRQHYEPRKPMTDDLRHDILARFNAGEGESVRAIAKDAGFSITTVSKVLREAGFETDPVVRNRNRALKEDGARMRQHRRLRQI